MSSALTFYEFFAGGGLARLGLGADWTCLFANDLSPKKAEVYRANFAPADELRVANIHDLTTGDLPGTAALAWASFPCQDLSLAGQGRGLRAARSGTFWPFWQLMAALERDGRAAPIIVLENVVGLLTSHQGQDFRELLSVLLAAGYRFGALVIDAAHFVPQSRPRLFIVAVKADQPVPPQLIDAGVWSNLWRPRAILHAFSKLPPELQAAWIWWDLPAPAARTAQLRDLIDAEPDGVAWHTSAETASLLALMAPLHREKVRQAQALGELTVGAVYKRMRVEDGLKRQRAEVRFDGVSGCLRTPVGGSSRQIIMVVDGAAVRSRLLAVREAARLMGLPERYQLPRRYNDGYQVMGDAVVVPVVAWLERHLLRPLALTVPEPALAGA
jgi:DNA (cytosine-5)-methyltransferase 1